MRELSDNVYLAIKKSILQHELAPGDRVIESDLARQLGVSRTPVREALKRLSQDGLIKPFPRQGYAISQITVSDVQEVFKLRTILEGEATVLATPLLSISMLDELEDAFAKQLVLTHTDDVSTHLEYLGSHNQFHTSVARSSGNVHLANIIINLLDESERYFFAKMNVVDKKGIEESLGVVRAIRTRDPEKASQSMQEHIQAVYKRLMEAILTGGIPGICC